MQGAMTSTNFWLQRWCRNLYWIWGVLLLSLTILSAAGEYSASVEPRSLRVYVGDNITLNCTLFDTESYDSTWLRFHRSITHELPLSMHHVISPSTVLLRLYNVSIQDSGNYFCFLNGSAAAFPATYIEIGKSPMPIEDMECKMNNLEDMICKYCEDAQGVTYTLSWTINSSSDHCVQNYGPDRCSCHIHGEKFHIFETYKFNITGLNDYGESYFIKTVVTDHSIMVAGPVEDFEFLWENSTSLNLSWNKNADNFVQDSFLSYKVIYRNLWDNEVQIKDTSTSSINLQALEPHTKYNITVYTMVETSPYLGNASSIMGQTGEAAPSTSPILVAYSQECPENEACRMTVYWMDIPDREQNGNITNYQVYVDDILTLHYHEVEHPRSSVSLTQPSSSESREMRIQARNLAGESPLSEPMLTSPDIVLPASWEVFGERNETSITFQWDSLPPGFDSVMLMSCQGPDPVTDLQCQSDVNVVYMKENETEYQLTSPGDDYVYGIAVQDADNRSSSLLNEWICIYDYSGLVPTPSFELAEKDSECVTILINPPACDRAKGRILHYNLMTCRMPSGCQSDEIVEIVSARTSTHKVCGLDADTNYEVHLEAVGNVHSEDATKEFSTDPKDYTVLIAVGISVPLFIISMIVIVLLMTKAWPRIKVYMKNLTLPVTVPEATNGPSVVVDDMDDVEAVKAHLDPSKIINGSLTNYSQVYKPINKQETTLFSKTESGDSAIGQSDSGSISAGSHDSDSGHYQATDSSSFEMSDLRAGLENSGKDNYPPTYAEAVQPDTLVMLQPAGSPGLQETANAAFLQDPEEEQRAKGCDKPVYHPMETSGMSAQPAESTSDNYQDGYEWDEGASSGRSAECLNSKPSSMSSPSVGGQPGRQLVADGYHRCGTQEVDDSSDTGSECSDTGRHYKDGYLVDGGSSGDANGHTSENVSHDLLLGDTEPGYLAMINTVSSA